MHHPVLQSADVRMVKCAELLKGANGAAAAPAGSADTSEAKEEKEEEEEEPKLLEASPSLEKVSLGPIESGLGLVLRHKDGAGPLSGAFFCTRACSLLEKPEEGAWRFVMDTVEVGAGYPFAAGSEQTELEMWPASEDGSVRCSMSGRASVNSRFFRWWSNLQGSSASGALAMLEA